MADTKPAGNSMTPILIGGAIFAALKYFHVWEGQTSFDIPIIGNLPISGETAQTIVSVLAALFQSQLLPAMSKIPGVSGLISLGKNVEDIKAMVKKIPPNDTQV